MNLREALRGELSENELRLVPSSFDIIGSVAIIEIPKELSKKTKKIGETLMLVQKNVKTVCNKLGEREGEFRLRNLKIIAGKKSTLTEHRENGCIFRLDVRKAYFSSREGTERQRIASMVRPKENVLVMFSGIAPFAIAIAKAQKEVGKVIAVEINPDAHKYALWNIRLNKVEEKVEAICKDAKEAVKAFGKFDRILMPLPKGSIDFLDAAFHVSKKGTVIHMYWWEREEELFGPSVMHLRKAAKRNGVKIKIEGKKKVLPYGPRTWKVCVECKVL